MNSGLNLSQHVLSLAALVVASKLFAAENGPTTRNILHPPPTSAASVAENPAATDVGPPKAARVVTPRELPPLPPGVTELKLSEFFRRPRPTRS